MTTLEADRQVVVRPLPVVPPATPSGRGRMLPLASALTATGFAAVLIGVLLARQPILAAALLLMIAGGLTLAMRPALAVYTLPLMPVLSGLGRGVPVPGFRLSELLSVGIGVVIIARGRMEPGSLAPGWRALDWTAALYTAVIIALPLADVTVGKGSGGITLDIAGPLQFLLLYRAAVVCLDTPKRRRRAMQTLLVSSVVTNVAAVLQALNVPGVRAQIDALIGLDPYATPGYVAVPRATGLFPHWHVLAGFDAAIVLLVIAYALKGSRILPTALLLVVGGLAIGGIAVSVTATDAIGVVIGGITIGALTGRLRWLVVRAAPVGIVALIISWPLIHARLIAQGLIGGQSTGTPQTISYRTAVWTQQYFPAIGHSFLTGWGPVLPSSILWPYPESVYLSLLIRGGVVLLGAYALWTVALLAAGWRMAKGHNEGSPAALALVALVASLAFMQVLFPYMLTDGLPGLIWLLAAFVRRGQETPAAAAVRRLEKPVAIVGKPGSAALSSNTMRWCP